MSKRQSFRLCSRKHLATTITIALFCSVSASVGAAPNESAHSLELTKVDLFAFKSWTSHDISVGGFMLEMTKQEVSRVAEQRGYKILDTLGRKQKCQENTCDVYSRSGRPLGVWLHYGENGKLSEIRVDSVDLYSGPDWAKDAMALKLHGNTYELFNHFS